MAKGRGKPPQNRPPESGRFKAGQSGNPGGRPKKLRELDELIQRDFLGHVPGVLTALRFMVMSGDDTAPAAAKLYLEYTVGKPRPRPDSRPLVDAPPVASVLELRERLLRVVASEAAALEATTRERPLTSEEASTLSGYLRALAPRPEDMSDAEIRKLLDAAGTPTST